MALLYAYRNAKSTTPTSPGAVQPSRLGRAAGHGAGSVLAPATPGAQRSAGARSTEWWSVRSVTRLRMRRW